MTLTNNKQLAILNVGNIVKGGAIQAAVNFIKTNIESPELNFDWHYILSPAVADELARSRISLGEQYITLSNSPAKHLAAREQALTYERLISPDFVFSLFGPSYIKFSSPHISGFANGWVTHSSFSTFRDTYKHHLLNMCKALIKYLYYAFKIRQADAWILETDTAMQGFIHRLKVSRGDCFVVNNTALKFDDGFQKEVSTKLKNKRLALSDNNFLALSADYPHKNLLILLDAAKSLKNELKQDRFKLLFTLDPATFDAIYLPLIKTYGLQDHIANLGKVHTSELSQLYSITYASILPSFIETFSAVYPESFATKTPVITTDAEFSREVCKKAALYVDPKSPINIANAMETLISNKAKYDELVSLGQEQHKDMLTPQQKNQQYNQVFKKFLASRH